MFWHQLGFHNIINQRTWRIEVGSRQKKLPASGILSETLKRGRGFWLEWIVCAIFRFFGTNRRGRRHPAAGFLGFSEGNEFSTWIDVKHLPSHGFPSIFPTIPCNYSLCWRQVQCGSRFWRLDDQICVAREWKVAISGKPVGERTRTGFCPATRFDWMSSKEGNSDFLRRITWH